MLLCAAQLAGAQGAQDANIRFGKQDRPGLLITFPYSQGITENALRARLDRAGLGKPKSDKGFMSFQAANWAEIAPGQLDVYAKVDAGKGDKQSTIALLVSKGYDNYVSASNEPAMSAKLKAWLDALLPDIQAQQLAADVRALEEAVARAEKDYKNADDDGNKLAREKEKIEKQLAENASVKQQRADALSAAKAKLDAAKAGTK